MHGSASTFIPGRTPEQVFDVLSDLERAPEWVPDLLSVKKLTPGPVVVGTRYAERVRMGSREGDAELEVTEHERPRVFAHRGKGGPASFGARFVLEAEDGGTRVTHEYELRMSGMFKLMTPMMAGWVKKNSEAAMASLARHFSGD